MKTPDSTFPKARIPYGTWGSSYFPAWQTSALAEVNIGQFAGEAMARVLSLRGVPKSALEYLVLGSTIPWHWKFWTAPLVASCMGERIPGYHVEQACATGLQAVLLAGGEIESRSKDVVGVLTFDRTSDSPVGVFPERRAHQRTALLRQHGFVAAIREPAGEPGAVGQTETMLLQSHGGQKILQVGGGTEADDGHPFRKRQHHPVQARADDQPARSQDVEQLLEFRQARRGSDHPFCFF